MKYIHKSSQIISQFDAIKSRYPDAIIIFHVGDFYETFREDAKTVAKILNIPYVERPNGKAAPIPMAGFPGYNFNKYLQMMIRAGLKVAVCEQIENTNLIKNFVKREIVKLISKE